MDSVSVRESSSSGSAGESSRAREGSLGKREVVETGDWNDLPPGFIIEVLKRLGPKDLNSFSETSHEGGIIVNTDPKFVSLAFRYRSFVPLSPFSEWIGKIPEGESRDRVLSALVGPMVDIDVDKARELAQQIQDPQKKSAGFRSVCSAAVASGDLDGAKGDLEFLGRHDIKETSSKVIVALIKKGKFADALDLAEQYDYPLKGAKLGILEKQLQTGDLEGAQETFNSLEDPAAFIYTMRIMREAETFRLIAPLIGEGLSLDEKLYLQAYERFEAGDVSNAEAGANSIEDASLKDRALRHFSGLLVQNGDFKRALEIYSQSCVHFWIARKQLENGDLNEALETVKEVKGPSALSVVNFYFDLSRALIQKGRLDEAKVLYNETFNDAFFRDIFPDSSKRKEKETLIDALCEQGAFEDAKMVAEDMPGCLFTINIREKIRAGNLEEARGCIDPANYNYAHMEGARFVIQALIAKGDLEGACSYITPNSFRTEAGELVIQALIAEEDLKGAQKIKERFAPSCQCSFDCMIFDAAIESGDNETAKRLVSGAHNMLHFMTDIKHKKRALSLLVSTLDTNPKNPEIYWEYHAPEIVESIASAARVVFRQ